MATVAGAPVVVGIDGSARSLDAVEVAATEASRRARPLRIVHAFVWPTVRVAIPPGATGPSLTVFRAQADAFLDEAVQAAGKAAPEVDVTAEVVAGAAAPVLLSESRHANLLVLGDRGLGGFTGLLVGSVAVQAATYGGCPVLVVRGRRREVGPVLVGVDGSETSQLAIRFAVEEAALRRTELVALHTWRSPHVTGPGDMMPLVYDPALLEAEEQRVLAESLAGFAERYPEVPVRPEVVEGAPGRVLTDWSHGAQLVVVGDRGHGGFAGLLLGSVSQHLIYHAACPVAVIRADRDG